MWFRVALPFRAEWVVVSYLGASWVSVFKAQLLPHALRHQQTCSAQCPRSFRAEVKVIPRRSQAHSAENSISFRAHCKAIPRSIQRHSAQACLDGWLRVGRASCQPPMSHLGPCNVFVPFIRLHLMWNVWTCTFLCSATWLWSFSLHWI